MRLLFAAILLLLFLNETDAQFRTRFTDLHFNYALNPKVTYNGSEYNVSALGGGLAANVGTEHISSFFEYNYQRISLKNLNAGIKGLNYHVFYLGLRYYPMRPTFLIGKTAFRVSGGAAAGLDLEPNWRGMFMAGMFISPILSTSGIAVHALYHPGKYSVSGYSTVSRWELRFSFVLGATATPK